MVDSCRSCEACQSNLEQYCLEGPTMTYATPDRVDGSNTMGGYSDSIVVSEHFVVRIPEKLDLASAAPGTFALTPSPDMLTALAGDYGAMSGMIFGDAPTFDAVMASISALETRLNDAGVRPPRS